MACRPDEVHVREHWVETYSKIDGTQVLAHLRSEHCREVIGRSYFQDSTSKPFTNFNGKLKSWTAAERKLLEREWEKLPAWLKKYKIANFLRASVHGANHKNPALTYPDSKTVILFDPFFDSPERLSILLHELSHIAVWDIDPAKVQNFLVSNGWIYEKGKSPTPPQKVIISDSFHSPSEDFANSVETYYSNPKRFREFNPKSFTILEGIIKSKENR